MEVFKINYDENSLKEIRVICKKDEKNNYSDLLDTIKIFCIDTVPSYLQHKVEELKGDSDEVGYLITCENLETGKKVLTHIFKLTYLVTRMAMIYKDELSKGSKLNVDDLDLSLLRPDIEKVEGLDYNELASLIGKLEKEQDHVES